ncbi:MAG: hypothetical protein JW864_18560 [Spirochaetes bacterium]|nr:hypothetical protein [Spirochaetota bacterium]
MVNNINKICLAVLLIFSFLPACSEEEEPVKISVIGTGGNFEGHYKVDGGRTVTFSGENIGYSQYEYEVEIDELDYIEVTAIKSTPSQTLEIKIYKDDVKVKSAQLSSNYQDSDDEFVTMLELDYEYGEEEDDESSTE